MENECKVYCLRFVFVLIINREETFGVPQGSSLRTLLFNKFPLDQIANSNIVLNHKFGDGFV